MALSLTPAQCRAARGLLDWTQEELAETAGVCRSTVRDFEKGRHDLSRSSEAQITAALAGAGVYLISAGEMGPGVRLLSIQDAVLKSYRLCGNSA
jgi:DNA-binding XRE family transcriptional regulator